MLFEEALWLLREKEKQSGYFLKHALQLNRYYQPANLEILSAADAYYQPAVSSKARIKWGGIFIERILKFFEIDEHQGGPSKPVFLVTIADRSHLTTSQPQQINLNSIKRKLRSALIGLSYVGMIEPGYFNSIYDENGRLKRDVISRHGHFLVWGASRKELLRWRQKLQHRVIRAIKHLTAVHIKKIPPDQLGQRIWYINKSPCKEYSVGKYSKQDKGGLPRYKQNSRSLRPGHRVKIFHLMREIRLPDLAMAGGDGRELLRKIKYEALQEYRRKY